MSLVKVDGDTVVAILEPGSKTGLKNYGSKTHDVYDTPQFQLFVLILSSQF